jgi:hypothetical protein
MNIFRNMGTRFNNTYYKTMSINRRNTNCNDRTLYQLWGKYLINDSYGIPREKIAPIQKSKSGFLTPLGEMTINEALIYINKFVVSNNTPQNPRFFLKSDYIFDLPRRNNYICEKTRFRGKNRLIFDFVNIKNTGSQYKNKFTSLEGGIKTRKQKITKCKQMTKSKRSRLCKTRRRVKN